MAKRSRRDIDIHHPNMVKTIFILTSLAIVAFLVLVVKYTSFKSEPKAAGQTQQVKYKVNRDNKICTSTFSNRLYSECPWSNFGNPCGFKYTLKGKIKTEKTSVVCGEVIPTKLEKLRNKFLNLPEPQTQKLYCCASEN